MDYKSALSQSVVISQTNNSKQIKVDGIKAPLDVLHVCLGFLGHYILTNLKLII